jgi:hypothetical protein
MGRRKLIQRRARHAGGKPGLASDTAVAKHPEGRLPPLQCSNDSPQPFLERYGSWRGACDIEAYPGRLTPLVEIRCHSGKAD